mmetsp:Transcript_12185/g.17756  ORF Transcript_12185/g.17756 Transcript_12185/m.17756 type:complete len:177 (+) Transcript_12185:1-531(+)
MTMVDKEMFGSGLNMTRNTLDELTKSGYAKEVTRQGNGMEFVEGEGQKAVPFQSLGENVGADELMDAGIQTNPYMDKNAPWLQTMPAEEARTGNEPLVQPEAGGKNVKDETTREDEARKIQDPIDLLTVTKLKEVLRKEGLKVSGNKQDLQERLKSHVKLVVDGQKKERKDGETWQ